MKTRKMNWFDVINYLVLTMLALMTILPFYNILIISFANNKDYISRSMYLIPTSFDLTAYTTIFTDPHFFNAIGVSIFTTVVGSCFSMLLTSVTAYTLSKKYIPGSQLILKLIIFTMFFSGGLIPYYLTVTKIGLVNSVFVMIIPSAIGTFYLLILRNYYMSLPPSLEESAKIDGANDIFILFKIVLPTSIPIITTLFLFYAVDQWNQYYNALLFITNKNLYPLQLFLRDVIRNFETVPFLQTKVQKSFGKLNTTSLQMAVICVTIIPIALVYPFVQKYFTKGIMVGAIKE